MFSYLSRYTKTHWFSLLLYNFIFCEMRPLMGPILIFVFYFIYEAFFSLCNQNCNDFTSSILDGKKCKCYTTLCPRGLAGWSQREESTHMGLMLSVTEVLPMVADFATVLSFICFVAAKLLKILHASTSPFLIKLSCGSQSAAFSMFGNLAALNKVFQDKTFAWK